MKDGLDAMLIYVRFSISDMSSGYSTYKFST